MSYKIKQGQSIYDIAILYGYGIEGVVNVLTQAPELESLNNNNLGGTDINVTKINTNLTDFLNLYATGISSVLIEKEVFVTEDKQTIFISEDGTTEFTFES